MLLAAGGLMLRSAARLHSVSPGFDAERVLVMDVAMPNGTYQWSDYAKVAGIHRTFQRELAQAPGVAGVGAIDDVPMGSADGWGCSGLGFEDASIDGGGGVCVPTSSVSPGYFETMRIPIVRGHAPTWDEVAGGSDGVVISQALVEHVWPGQDPIGRGVMANTRKPPYFHVVGVAGDVRMDGLEKPPTEVVYFPMVPDSGLYSGLYMWGASRNVSVMVRTTTDDVLGALRLAVGGVAVGLVGAVATMRVLQSLLYDVSPTDPLTLGGVALLLLALAALASWIPARRASRVPPMEALRG